VDRTSTGWWQQLCRSADLILQVNKKIHFVNPDNDPTNHNALGSSLVAYGGRGVQALKTAANYGLGTLFLPYEKSRAHVATKHAASHTETNSENDEPAWVTPPEFLAELDQEFHFTLGYDPCPYPRPEGFDGLKVSWPESTYCNPPFRKQDGIGIAAFARKAIDENKLGKTVVLVLPTFGTINCLLEAGAELRSAGRINWIDPKTGEPATTSPSSNMLAILRGKAHSKENEIAELKARIAELEADNAALKTRIEESSGAPDNVVSLRGNAS
jgi:hypothetical protein